MGKYFFGDQAVRKNQSLVPFLLTQLILFRGPSNYFLSYWSVKRSFFAVSKGAAAGVEW
jgi:hypothetical protein